MKHYFSSGIFVLLASLTSASPILAPAAQQGCDRSNRAMLLSAQRQAEADFWLRVAQCFAGPAGNLPCGLEAAYIGLRDAHAQATAVFEARQRADALFGHAPYDPQIVAAEFSSTLTNPWFQRVPGRTLVWEKETSEGLERIESRLLSETKLVQGVTCRIVREHETLDGALVEDTFNWVAQHSSGAVWYFGELSLTYDDGTLDSLDGSWRFGKDGALPGILMESAPATGDAYRQEFLLGTAEDIAQVLRVGETVQVPAGTFDNCLVIAEWDPLEPLEYLLKFIAPDVGMVLEIDPKTGERSELVEIQD